MITTSEGPGSGSGNVAVRIALVGSVFVHAFVFVVALVANVQLGAFLSRAVPVPQPKPQFDEIVTISTAPRHALQPRPAAGRLALAEPRRRSRPHFAGRQRPTPAALAGYRRGLATHGLDSYDPDDPLNVSPDPAAAPRRYRIELQGILGHLRRGEGIYYPTKGWRSGGLDYYFVAYQYTYADGTLESGNVPWPIHFPPDADPFVSPDQTLLRHTAMPGPPLGFVPSGDLGRALRAYFPSLHFEDGVQP